MQFDMIFFLIKYKIEIIYRHTIPLKRQANKLEETWEESTDVKVRVSLVGLPYVSMYCVDGQCCYKPVSSQTGHIFNI